MKTFSCFIAIALFACFAFAQTPPASKAPANEMFKTTAEQLNWMIGEWEGQGMLTGDREFVGKMSIASELDGLALLVHRESMNKTGGVGGGRKELMIIGYDGASKKFVATIYTNDGAIIGYVGELKEKQLIFSLPSTQSGIVSRRTYSLATDGGLSLIIEGAAAGKEVTKQVEIKFKKK
jgi:hypothetical protein